MKVQASVKWICRNCRIVRRKGVVQIRFFNHRAAFDADMKDYVALEVSDNGRGIPPGRLGGLGLTGIQERLRRHGGRFEVHSTARGTTVHVRVPLPSAAGSPAA